VHVREHHNVWIPLTDGCRLAARLWLPEDAEVNPVPAILEYLPYRKDDATANQDSTRHPYFAQHGYAAVRVDIRGTGDSDGLLEGEYLPQEQDDALEVLTWLAEQPWCTGDVGMIGYSWGGFNGLQIAARRPPQLKAVVSAYSTDDRYTDDCHYMGGCVLGSDMLKWATSMRAYAALPPDPRFRDDWREVWLERLEKTPALVEQWLTHQTRDEFWRHGSVAEDYSAIEAATLLVGGWADAYTNAVPRLLQHLSCERRGLIGPWGHFPQLRAEGAHRPVGALPAVPAGTTRTGNRVPAGVPALVRPVAQRSGHGCRERPIAARVDAGERCARRFPSRASRSLDRGRAVATAAGGPGELDARDGRHARRGRWGRRGGSRESGGQLAAARGPHRRRVVRERTG